MGQQFAWKDLITLPRYHRQQLFLDNSLRLIYAPGLFSSVLLSLLTPAAGFRTAVQSLTDDPYPYLIAQLYHPAGQPSAGLTFLAPADLSEHPGFLRLLAALSKKAGERGAWQILAEAPADLQIQDTLYQAGYRPYTRQRVYKLPRAEQDWDGKQDWCSINGLHQEEINSLYHRCVPNQIQRVEPPHRFPNLQGLAFLDQEHLLGYAAAEFGPRGVMVDPVFSPDLGDLENHLQTLVKQLSFPDSRPVYVRTRDYQTAVISALDSLGAQAGPQQTAVVKRLAVHYNAARKTFGISTFEKRPDITTPISNTSLKK